MGDKNGKFLAQDFWIENHIKLLGLKQGFIEDLEYLGLEYKSDLIY